ncbi:MAG: MFS transporter [Polyangiaceae bacterium]|nr:MFS transporter [Polyangiaceae bacterium]
MPKWLEELLPILILLGVIGVVVWRLPKVELGHTAAFRRRRVLNWLPLGLSYAFLYMGRYNLIVAKDALGMNPDDFGTIKAVGTIVYGLSFIVNGPLTDRIGGRKTMLICIAGTVVMNAAMGMYLLAGPEQHLVLAYSLLYGVNMYFQSFGAVSIVKVNAQWFHLRERGTFGGIFGILISLGIYFAFDWGSLIVKNAPIPWVFFVPALILGVFFVLDYFLVFDSPSDVGLGELETGDAKWEGDAGTVGVARVARMMLTNPVILVIGAIELCSGFLRSALMDWYTGFAKFTKLTSFVSDHWGMMQCVAGILGGMVAGMLSDMLFKSRRGPMSGILYGILVLGGVAMALGLTTPALGPIVTVMMLSIIGVHGMLSGTASMDFGGKKNVGVAVGIIDGLVYLGQGGQVLLLGQLLPKDAARADPANWSAWPLVMIPAAAVGFLLALRLWNARPKGQHAPAH